MVDLFIYREPEESRKPEEEDRVVASDFALTAPEYGLGPNDWSSTIPDGQWTADVPQQPIAATPAANYPEQDGFSGGWDTAAPPAAVAPAIGWE
uniref:40S ribosomal protein SA n=1 Tax=Rhizophora mucronata TaxID=61149 RepID=A0A2P2QP90_RHIMU